MEKDFSAQPRLKGEDLDDALLQVYYVGLEALDGTQLDWDAVEAKDLAVAAQAAAESARDSAVAAKETAETAVASIGSAVSDAQSAASAAQTAETNAETAETHAETAETNAGLAKTAAEAARDTALGYRDAALAAKTAAETAETNAETAETNAELAQVAAEAAQGAAEDARDAAQAYASHAASSIHDEVGSAPATVANQVAIYAKDVSGATELYVRKESNGAEVRITNGSNLNGGGSHAATHKSAGDDPIKLDELAAPSDVTTLNASVGSHGLCPKLSGNAGDALKGDGSWGPAGGAPGGSNTQVQFNDGGAALGGDAGLTYNKTTNKLTCSNDIEAKRHMEPAVYANGDSGGSKQIDWANGQSQSINLTGAPGCAITFANPTPGSLRLLVYQGSGGSKTATWPTIYWAGGVAPVLSTAAGALDIITLYYTGSAYVGMWASGFATV